MGEMTKGDNRGETTWGGKRLGQVGRNVLLPLIVEKKNGKEDYLSPDTQNLPLFLFLPIGRNFKSFTELKLI